MTTGIQNSQYKPAEKCLGPKTLQAPHPSRGQISETPRDQEGGEDRDIRTPSCPCNNLPTHLEQKGPIQILLSTISETPSLVFTAHTSPSPGSAGSALLWADPQSPSFTFPSQRIKRVQRSHGQHVKNIPAASLTPPPTLFQHFMRLPLGLSLPCP